MKKILSLITLLFLLFLSFVSLSQTITTVPINGSTNPISVAFDTMNSLIISDIGFMNYKIRKLLDTSGSSIVIAGTGLQGSSGDGGPALSAELNGMNIDIDKNNNLFISSSSQVPSTPIRKISNGIIDLYKPIYDCNIIKCDSKGNIYAAWLGGNFLVIKIDTLGDTTIVAGVQGHKELSLNVRNMGSSPATSCGFFPNSIGIDNYDNIYIADFQSQRILKVDVVSGIINTVVGNGLTANGLPVLGSFGGDQPHFAVNTQIHINFPLLNYAVGIAFDKNNNLYFSDINNHRIRKVDAITGIITTVIPFDTNVLKYPSSLAFDKDDNLFVVDYGNKRVRKIDFSNGPNSIKDTKIDKTISVYPNPFQDILSVKSDLEINSIQIVNTLGQNVISQKGNKSNSVTLDTKTLKSGLYFININNNISKIIKQ